jgi:hypothetical protein
MKLSKRVSRRKVVAASGAALIPLAVAGDAAAQGAPPQAPQPPAGAKPPMGGPRPMVGDPFYPPEGANKPMGVAKGIFPGRVVWVHNPEACTWDEKTGEWWDDANTNGPLVDSMVSTALQGMTGKKTDKQAWDAIFRHWNQTHGFGDVGYKPGEKITIKMNSNYDRSNSQPWPSGKGLASPHVINAMIVQLVRNAGIPGKDITLYDVANGRYMGDPIYNRIRANPEPDFKEITFMVSPLVAANGRVPPTPSTTDPVRFSNEELAKTQNPIVQVPQCVIDAKYRINLATWRAHEVAAVTLCAKNNFGSIYWPNLDYWGPRPFHSGWNTKTRPQGSYSIFTDIMGHDQLGEKNILYMSDSLYTAEHSELNVVRFVSFGDQWTASIFMSQDPVAIDSVGLDFFRAEPRQPMVRGNADNYLHESALADNPPSKTVYTPSGKKLASLGVHEHWNNPNEKKYSRNLGKKEGIELVALKAAPKKPLS